MTLGVNGFQVVVVDKHSIYSPLLDTFQFRFLHTLAEIDILKAKFSSPSSFFRRKADWKRLN